AGPAGPEEARVRAIGHRRVHRLGAHRAGAGRSRGGGPCAARIADLRIAARPAALSAAFSGSDLRALRLRRKPDLDRVRATRLQSSTLSAGLTARFAAAGVRSEQFRLGAP